MLNKLFEEHYDALNALLNCLKVGVYIADGAGVTRLVNDESCKTGGLTREKVLNRHMADLVREGFVTESVTLKTLESGLAETLVQDLGDGGKTFVSSHPYYADGKIAYVITTERDITETLILKGLLEEKARETVKYENEIAHLRDRNISAFGIVVAMDELSRSVVGKALRVAPLDATVLLTGESGTGKEVYANLIYKNSLRVGKPFIKVNTAAIPENLLESEMFGYEKGAFTGAKDDGKMGYFELANGGTLFLDEIGDLPIHLQSKLLRVLQEKEILRIGATRPLPVDIRLITATNADLKRALREGRFREDLYYRLAVMPIEVPPLRERKNDIAALAVHLTRKLNTTYKLNKFPDASAVTELENYSWPGNVRELRNVLERAVISFDGDTITGSQIRSVLYPTLNAGEPAQVADEDILRGDAPLPVRVEAYEKRLIQAALRVSKNASEASLKLGIQKSKMCRRMKKYGIGV